MCQHQSELTKTITLSAIASGVLIFMTFDVSDVS